MARFKLKPKQSNRLKLKQKISRIKSNDPYALAIASMNGEQNEELALDLLMEVRDKIFREEKAFITNEWYKFDDTLPPLINRQIIVYYKDIHNQIGYETHSAFTFMQHYLLDKYYWGFKDRPLSKILTHFMVLEFPS